MYILCLSITLQYFCVFPLCLQPCTYYTVFIFSVSEKSILLTFLQIKLIIYKLLKLRSTLTQCVWSTWLFFLLRFMFYIINATLVIQTVDALCVCVIHSVFSMHVPLFVCMCLSINTRACELCVILHPSSQGNCTV